MFEKVVCNVRKGIIIIPLYILVMRIMCIHICIHTVYIRLYKSCPLHATIHGVYFRGSYIIQARSIQGSGSASYTVCWFRLALLANFISVMMMYHQVFTVGVENSLGTRETGGAGSQGVSIYIYCPVYVQGSLLPCNAKA